MDDVWEYPTVKVSPSASVEFQIYKLLRAHQLLEGNKATRELAERLSKFCVAWSDGLFDGDDLRPEDAERRRPDWKLVHTVQKLGLSTWDAARPRPGKRRKRKRKAS